jgi:zinc D-Ala-D-Ala carboxypeptidase
VIVDQHDTDRFGKAHSEMIDGSRPGWPRGRESGIQVFVGGAESSLVSVKRVAFCAIALLVVASSAPAAAYPFSRILEEGDRGRDVLALEVRVAGWYPLAKQQALLINRRFGRRTKVAVEAFQRHYGLAVDGIAGAATYSVLDSLQDKNGSTEHFNWSEFEQNYNRSCSSQANAYAGTFGGGMVAPRKVKGHVRRLMWRLEALRAKGGSHLIGINSGFRSVKYNQCIGGAGLSQHMYGTAVDNRMAHVRNRRERNIAKRSQLSGIGCYASLSHNHFDTRIDNRDLASSRFWWWPERDSKGRDLDATGRPCWGERARKAGRSPAGGSRQAGPQSLVPSVREVRAFQAAGEPADLLGAD